MTDIERRIREVLEEEARLAPAPHEARSAIRRTRRRQSLVVVASALGVAAALAVGALTFGMLASATDDRVVGSQPTVTRTMNGITITIPRDWMLIDPDRAGLNGEGRDASLPRLMLFLTDHPTRVNDARGLAVPDAAISCPGLATGPSLTFVMTVQEHPLALSGPASTAWPVEPVPLAVDGGESACYPSWEFLRAGWTAEGRTFEGRIGFSPDASEADRAGLLGAFAGMRFEPATEPPSSVVLTTGSAGGERWKLLATRQGDGLSLSLEGDSFGIGSGGYGDTPGELRLTSHVFGQGADRELVVFGAVQSNVVRVEARSVPGGSEVAGDVLDVPDTIDGELNAFVVVLPEAGVVVTAYDEAGDLVLRATAATGLGADDVPPGGVSSLEVGRHFGFVRSVDVVGRAVEFDLAYLLSGEEATRAYQEHGGTGPVPNDYYIVNDNPRLRTLALSPDAKLVLLDWAHCCDVFFDGDLEPFARAIEREGDVTVGGQIYRGVSAWWITVEGGEVTLVEEQYLP